MKRFCAVKYAFDLIFAAIAIVALLAVLQTFIIGQHYIIPSVILVPAVVFGNIARYGLQDQPWAKQLLFWSGFLFTAHAFMALFFSKRYREILGDAFEPVCILAVIVFGFLVYRYGKDNKLFGA